MARLSACRTFAAKREMIKPNFFAALLCVLAALWVGGCAGPVSKTQAISQGEIAAEMRIQQEIAIQESDKLEQRLYPMAYKLRRAALPVCGKDTTLFAGLRAANLWDFKPEWRESVRRYHRLDSGSLSVLSVFPSSPAARAGLKKGDVIVGPQGKKASERFGNMLKAAFSDGAIALKVKRGTEIIDVRIVFEKICSYPVILVTQDAVNAYADGEKVAIATGMMRFASDDNDLALVVAHELAHNAMGHISKAKLNALGGALIDGLLSGLTCAYGNVCPRGGYGLAEAGRLAFSKEFEAEADYVGLYIAARAGINIDNAALFWRRMAALNPGSIESNHSATHPSSPERFLAIQKTIREIKDKQDRGLPLLPELKK